MVKVYFYLASILPYVPARGGSLILADKLQIFIDGLACLPGDLEFHGSARLSLTDCCSIERIPIGRCVLMPLGRTD
jgi:hypothetical protein